jgi:cellobiose transport system substrate-binding protein
MRVKTRRRRGAMALIAAAALVAAAACGNNGDNGEESTQQITLVVDLFGEEGFGYDELYRQYEEDNPHIRIEERGRGLGLGDYNDRLVQQIVAGSGAGDVVALEAGTIVQFYAQLDRFVDLADHGAADLEGNFLPWKWNEGAPGGFILGLGTDVGSLGLCYRSDLFADAGLPSDRDEVAQLWHSWEDFIEVGREFSTAGTGVAFVDAATNFYNSVLMSVAGDNSGYTYFTPDGELDLDNPDIRTAWDLTIEMVESGLSAGLNTFSDEWNAGIQNSAFATNACPAWMTGVIQGGAGDAVPAGLWDVAEPPAGGNWGGSFLAVPAETEHPEEAAKLAMFLTSPEAQTAAFQAVGNLPSSPQALASDAVAQASNEYFSGAPTGQIFGAGAEALRPVYLGPLNEPVRSAFEGALQSVEQGEATSEQAWDAALSDAALAARG